MISKDVFIVFSRKCNFYFFNVLNSTWSYGLRVGHNFLSITVKTVFLPFIFTNKSRKMTNVVLACSCVFMCVCIRKRMKEKERENYLTNLSVSLSFILPFIILSHVFFPISFCQPVCVCVCQEYNRIKTFSSNQPTTISLPL